MDGLETLLRIRERIPDVPVIMLTGLNDAETAVRALRAGAADYLTKPFELKRLFDLLQGFRREKKEEPATKPVTATGSLGKGTASLKSCSRSCSTSCKIASSSGSAETSC